VKFGIVAMLAACSSHPSSLPRTAVVVGVEAEPLTGVIGTIHVATTVEGAPATDDTFGLQALPREVRLVAPAIDPNAAISVRVEGYQATGASPPFADPPLLVRTAATHFVAGQVSLLRVMLQGSGLPMLPGGLPGAPTCVAPQTCKGGSCQDDTVSPQSLERYTPQWPANAPDICKPAGAGAGVVQVGTGQSDYLPLTGGQTLQAEQGPQGGHHIWIAVRQQNLKQSGSTTTITSVQPGTGLVGPRTSFAFTFDPDEGGFCKLHGLRYQLDVDGIDYHQFLGKPLDVTVVIADPSGATGTGIAHVNIDPQILCPSGTTGC
jgi:hypothetical protein